MTPKLDKRDSSDANLIFGAILVALGALFLAGQVLRVNVGHYLWPFFVIVPGASVYLLSLTTSRQGSEAMAVVGSIITAVGGLLFYQNLTGHWASWAYAWALVTPTGIGLGLMLYGIVKGMADRVTTGTRMVIIGLTIFLVGAVFFELILGISGFGLGSYAWSLLLIGFGVLWLLGALLPRPHRT